MLRQGQRAARQHCSTARRQLAAETQTRLARQRPAATAALRELQARLHAGEAPASLQACLHLLLHGTSNSTGADMYMHDRGILQQAR